MHILFGIMSFFPKKLLGVSVHIRFICLSILAIRETEANVEFEFVIKQHIYLRKKSL